MKKLVILGSGGYGRELRWLIDVINEHQPTWEFLGFLDDTKPEGTEIPPHGMTLGPFEALGEIDDVHVACGVASPSDRKQIVERLKPLNPRWANLISPYSGIGPGAEIGEGLVIQSQSTVSVNAQIGSHVHIQNITTIGHDVKMGNYCTVSPYVHVCGYAEFGEGVFLGAHSVVTPHAHVGDWAYVGAGTVTLRRVPAGAKVFGVPGKQIN